MWAGDLGILEEGEVRNRMRQSIWERFTIERLKDIEIKRNAYRNVLDHINRLRGEATKVKGPVLDSTPVNGGMLNKEEERRLNNLSLCEELEDNAKKLRKDINIFNQAWVQLNENEQLVLTYFYVGRPANYIEKLMERLCYEKSKVYYLKDEALYKLTMLIYGNK
jgi:hypothetical protein